MKRIVENDVFWEKLYRIWESVVDKNENQIKLGLNRVDYMLEKQGIKKRFKVQLQQNSNHFLKDFVLF